MDPVQEDAGEGVELLTEDTEPSEGLQLLPFTPATSASQPMVWSPGEDCGVYMRRSHAIHVQAQVLIANVYSVLSRAGQDTWKAVLRAAAPLGKLHNTGGAARAGSALLRLPVQTVTSVWQWLRKRNFAPASRLLPGRKPKEQHAAAKRDADACMRSLVRTALGLASRAAPFEEFFDEIARKAVEGLDVGDRYHTKYFYQQAQYVGSAVVAELISSELAMPLPGLGIRSDIALSWDGVGLGSSMFTRHEHFSVIGCETVDAFSGHLKDVFLGAPSSGQDHRGEASANVIETALAQEPFNMTTSYLRHILAAIGVDGAGTAGGPEARHPSTQSAEIFFRKVFPDANCKGHVIWDRYHRCDIAGKRACRDHAMVQEQFDVAAALDHYFGVNQGRVLYQSVAEEMGLPGSGVQPASSTRTIGALATSPGAVFENYATIHASLHARIAWARDKRGSQSISSVHSSGIGGFLG